MEMEFVQSTSRKVWIIGQKIQSQNNGENNFIPRIFELLKDGSASINCYVDENGRCRKKFELGGRIDIIEVDEELEEDSLSLIEWLEQFAKPRYSLT